MSPSTVRPSHGRPTPLPTEHCAPGTGPGNRTEMSALRMSLDHPGAITFQKNTDGPAGLPTADANCLLSPVVPGSSTPGML